MLLNTIHFCGLSSDPKFLTWIRGVALDIHDNLAGHTRESSGCTANTRKMLWVLDQLVRRPGLESSLISFLRENHPHVITEAPTANKSTPVFDHYDPTLLTIPRRLILDNEGMAQQFLHEKVGEYVMVDDKAYIEYLPKELAGLLPQIPNENWQTRAWRRRIEDAGETR